MLRDHFLLFLKSIHLQKVRKFQDAKEFFFCSFLACHNIEIHSQSLDSTSSFTYLLCTNKMNLKNEEFSLEIQ